MKSGALCLHCRGLALADFGRDPRSSDSWRARRIVFSCHAGMQRTNLDLPISRRPNVMKFKHNTFIGKAVNTLGTEF